MVERKYQKYIIDTTQIPESVIQKDAQSGGKLAHVIWLDESVFQGAFFLNLSWMNTLGTLEKQGHTHDFDEILGFMGSDWENPTELNGEIEFWLEEEKYILIKSCIMFIPKGMKHCPLKVLRVDRPIIHLGTGTAGKLVRVINQEGI